MTLCLGSGLSLCWFFACLFFVFPQVYLVKRLWDSHHIGIDKLWYVASGIIITLPLLTRMIVAILAIAQRKPGCDCWQSRALFGSNYNSGSENLTMVSYLPRFLGFLMLTFGFLAILGDFVISFLFRISIMLVISLFSRLGAIALGILQVSHVLCDSYHEQMPSIHQPSISHQSSNADSNDISFEQSPIDLSLYRTAPSISMIEGSTECAICSDTFTMDEQVISLPCSHFFHEKCVEAWLTRGNFCPLCRKSLSISPPSTI